MAANGDVTSNGNGHLHTNGNGNSATEDPLANYSELQKVRMEYVPRVPSVLQGPFKVSKGEILRPEEHFEELQKCFPKLIGQAAVRLESCDNAHNAERGEGLTVGIVLSGGQAPGGHNVIAGLFDHLQSKHPGSRLLGFSGGPKGILTCKFKEITQQDMARFRHQGGFNMICSGRDKIESQADLATAAETAKSLRLDGLVVVGGDDSNTNAAVLAEYFVQQGLSTCVVGVPKTIDGDLKNDSIPVSFGFDTACKVYSEMIGNIMIDAASAKKYWHWIRLMGRSASHITLECALQTHPQAAIMLEEVDAQKQGLRTIANYLADIVQARSEQGRDYGVVLLPEGLIEVVPDVGTLIGEINDILARGVAAEATSVAPQLTPSSRQVFDLLPASFQNQLLLDRDPHGNVQVARIETERLILGLVDMELSRRKQAGTFNGKFSGLTHYLGYEGRASLPTNFDATYCYALGHAACALLGARQTGLMATLSNIKASASEWVVGGTPLPSMMAIEHRKGKNKPVIRKALVKLEDAPFKAFEANRKHWALEDCYRSPGPIQFFGGGIADTASITLALEQNNGRPVFLH